MMQKFPILPYCNSFLSLTFSKPTHKVYLDRTHISTGLMFLCFPSLLYVFCRIVSQEFQVIFYTSNIVDTNFISCMSTDCGSMIVPFWYMLLLLWFFKLSLVAQVMQPHLQNPCCSAHHTHLITIDHWPTLILSIHNIISLPPFWFIHYPVFPFHQPDNISLHL
jgi:hypothetical protein